MTDVGCAVVGGGISGASVAYHLSERDADDVVVFERGTVGSETTEKSFAMFGTYGNRTQYELKGYAMGLYNRLARESAHVEYDRIGHFSVATTTEAARRLERAVRGEGEAGIFATGGDRTGVQYLEPDEIERRVFLPALDATDVTGGVYRPEVGYFDPVSLTEAMLARARENGVEVREQRRVTEVLVEDGEAAGVVVDGTRVTADSVVLAAGPWTADLAETADVDLPVRHTIAPVLVLDPGARPQTLPSVKHHESDVNVRGVADSGTVYVGSHRGNYEQGERIDPDAVPSSFPSALREEAFAVLERLLPPLAEASPVDEWVGVRSLTPDGDPIVGWTAVEDLFVVAFNTSGIQLAPGVGRMVASQLLDGEPTRYYETLSISRFEGYQDCR